MTASGCSARYWSSVNEFAGPSFHTYDWPTEPVDLEGKRVGVVGTGATGVQVIGEIADKVGDLTVFQRRPNWCAPLHNAEITPEEMAEIKARYDDIFAVCARTPGGFIRPDAETRERIGPTLRRTSLWASTAG